MNHWMALGFLAAGIILAVAEIATLTFYLAALAFAALVTAVITWVYPAAWWQAAVVFLVAAIVALPLAHAVRRRMQTSRSDAALDDMDKGAMVTIAENDHGLLKVQYRDSLWEAVWEGPGKPETGARAEVAARDGSRLRIKAVR